MARKCPKCGCPEIWDMDCDDCDGGEEACPACEGSGYIEGWAECSECGYVDMEYEFEEDEI